MKERQADLERATLPHLEHLGLLSPLRFCLGVSNVTDLWLPFTAAFAMNDSPTLVEGDGDEAAMRAPKANCKLKVKTYQKAKPIYFKTR